MITNTVWTMAGLGVSLKCLTETTFPDIALNENTDIFNQVTLYIINKLLS